MTKSDLAQTLLPGSVLGATLWGMTLQDWASVLAIVFLLMQIAWFAWEKVIKPRRSKRVRK